MNDLIKNNDKAMTDIITFINRSSNLKMAFPTKLIEGGVTRPWRSLADLYNSFERNFEDKKYQ